MNGRPTRTRSRTRVLVIVLAGGAGGRLGPLTASRAKPAIPFAGMYRLIDITLSNVAHSGLDDVWVVEQYEPHDLNDHLANGRPWDLDRTHGGLQILPPFQRRGDGDGGPEVMAEGNADALVQHRGLIAAHGADVVITMSADHVYRLDLRDVLDTHDESQAELTVVTTDVPDGDDPSRFAWVSVSDGAVRGFEYKPDVPSGDRVCAEVFTFDAPALLAALGRLPTDGAAGDYGDHLVPDLVAGGRVVEHRHAGYWRDVGTIAAFHRAHLELLGADPALRLDDPGWPFLTGSIVGAPARVLAGGQVADALLSPGTLVAGTVRESVLGRNVVVEAGATVERSVVLDDAVVRAGATVADAIVDAGVEVGPADGGQPDEDSGIVLHVAI